MAMRAETQISYEIVVQNSSSPECTQSCVAAKISSDNGGVLAKSSAIALPTHSVTSLVNLDMSSVNVGLSRFH